MKKILFMLVVMLTAFAVPARAQFGAPKTGKECVGKICAGFDAYAAVTNDISDPTMLEKAFEPLNPLMENMTKEMKPFRDYVLDEEDKANVSKALMGFMTALNKFMGAPEEELQKGVDVQVGKMKTLKDLIDGAPGQ